VEGVDLMPSRVDADFWRDRRVLLTGHTGFKGGWAALWLASMGARVTGLALPPDDGPSFYASARLSDLVSGTFGDVRDASTVAALVAQSAPDIVIHMAAQSLVLRSLREPLQTFDTNIMGTARLLEALRMAPGVKVILIVTTDKVYRNTDTGRRLREDDALGGHDPYSASKAAAEIVTSAYAHAFFARSDALVATARAGNVIGGGDFAADRIVPDIYRAMTSSEQLVVRNPEATRPWHYVLDCVAGYLIYLQALANCADVPRAFNFGPPPGPELRVRDLVGAMQAALGMTSGWRCSKESSGGEKQYLALDSSLAEAQLGWRPKFNAADAIGATAA
jgi:CDP-glucose 4,6-dehydratase